MTATTDTTSTERMSTSPDTAEAWVAGFAEGWRAPAGAAGLVANFAPMLSPEVRLIQPQMPTLVGLEAFRHGFAEPPEPFVQMFDRAGNGPFTIPYAKIATITFTGKDTAAGKSYEAWIRRKGEGSTSDSARGA